MMLFLSISFNFMNYFLEIIFITLLCTLLANVLKGFHSTIGIVFVVLEDSLIIDHSH